jgi:hypothetical protein
MYETISCVFTYQMSPNPTKKHAGSLFIHFTTCSNSTEKLILIKALIQSEYEEIHKQYTTTESASKNVLIPK